MLIEALKVKKKFHFSPYGIVGKVKVQKQDFMGRWIFLPAFMI